MILISLIRMEELQKATLRACYAKFGPFCLNNGWPEKYKSVPPEVRSFFPVRDKLITSNNIVMKSQRVVMPDALCTTYIVQDTLGLMPQYSG